MKRKKLTVKKGSPKSGRPAIPLPTGPHEYSEDGVDLTLIRWMLSLTPRERLEVLQQEIRSIKKPRGKNRDKSLHLISFP